MKSETRKQTSSCSAVLEVRHSAIDISAAWLDHPGWRRAEMVRIAHYWSGAEAPEGRRAEARILWSDAALHVHFICRQTEDPVVNPVPQTVTKTLGLWNRDVCEIFIAPDHRFPDRYFEFEAAPTGEWVDLAIQNRGDTRDTDFEFNSGMTAAGRVLGSEVTVAMRIPWSASIPQPQSDQRWRANLYRCVGSGEDRGYLVWQPTRTRKPDFHVPEAFGELLFI